jgi:hypothetical protein
VAAVLVHTTGGWQHTMEIVEAPQATVDHDAIAVGDTARIALQGDDVLVNARTPHVDLDIRARPLTLPLAVEDAIPFGSGWIAWRASPRLRVMGDIRVFGEPWPDSQVVGYHDHNWGRWHWGEDVGWEWAALIGEQSSLVMAGIGGRDHRRHRHRLWGWIGSRPVWFDLSTVTVSHRGRQESRLLRAPGAMAALHGERRAAHLPAETTISAYDGFDTLTVTQRHQDSVQIITADPVVSGSGFIHEMAGSFEVVGRVGGASVSDGGRGVGERVN